MPAAFKDDRFLLRNLTPERLAEWDREATALDPKRIFEKERMRIRWDQLRKAKSDLSLEGMDDPNHYKNGRPYCRHGSVNDHNRAQERILAGANDGR